MKILSLPNILRITQTEDEVQIVVHLVGELDRESAPIRLRQDVDDNWGLAGIELDGGIRDAIDLQGIMNFVDHLNDNEGKLFGMDVSTIVHDLDEDEIVVTIGYDFVVITLGDCYKDNYGIQLLSVEGEGSLGVKHVRGLSKLMEELNA